jgi:hypothetical protein
MKPSTNFTPEELTRSDTAVAPHMDNTPDKSATACLRALVDNTLRPIRERYGKPVYANSGYRSLALNKAVKGAANGRHTEGKAADITAGSPKENGMLFDLIAGGDIPFDQPTDVAFKVRKNESVRICFRLCCGMRPRFLRRMSPDPRRCGIGRVRARTSRVGFGRNPRSRRCRASGVSGAARALLTRLSDRIHTLCTEDKAGACFFNGNTKSPLYNTLNISVYFGETKKLF